MNCKDKKSFPLVFIENLEPRTLLSVALIHSTSQLPVAEENLSAFDVGDEVVLPGGRTSPSANPGNTLEIFNAHTARWYNDTAQDDGGYNGLLTGQHIIFQGYDFNVATGQSTLINGLVPNAIEGGLQQIAVDGKAIFAGGGYENSLSMPEPSDYTAVYDPATGQVDANHVLSDARDPYTDAIGDQALFVGAGPDLYPEGVFIDSTAIDIYHADTNTWSTASLSAPVSQFATANVGNEAIFAGGDLRLNQGAGFQPYAEPTAIVNIYHADTGQVTAASLSLARNSIASAVVGNLAVFAGGEYFPRLKIDSTKPIHTYVESTVDIYDSTTGQWSTASLSVPRENANATVVGNDALFAGGATATDEKTVDIFNATSNTWSTTQMPIALTAPQSVTVNQFVFYYSQTSPTVEVFNTQTNTWVVLPISSPRAAMAAAALGNQAIFAGGVAGNGTGKHVSGAVDIFTPTYVASTSSDTANRPVSPDIQNDPTSWLQSSGEIL